jgi:hypothetical protein
MMFRVKRSHVRICDIGRAASDEREWLEDRVVKRMIGAFSWGLAPLVILEEFSGSRARTDSKPPRAKPN